MKQIILEDSETRLNVLRHIFGIDKYKRMRENLIILNNRLKEEIRSLQGSIQDLEINKQNLEILKRSLQDLEKNIAQKESLVKEKIQFRKNIEKEVTELDSKIKEKISLEKEVEKTKIMIVTKKESINLANKEIIELQSSLSDSKNEFNIIEYNEILKKIEEENKQIEYLNKKYIDVSGELSALSKEKEINLEKKERVFGMRFCPTCLQNVSAPHRHNILLSAEQRMAEIKVRSEELEKAKKELEMAISNLRKEKRSLEEKKLDLEILKSRISYLERSKKKLDELSKTKISLEKDMVSLVNHAERLKETILQFSKFDTHFRLKQDSLKNSFLEEKNAEIAVAELNKEIEFEKKTILQIESVIAQKFLLKDKLSGLLSLSDWLSSHYISLIDFIERNIMIKLRNEFSRLFNKWFNMLVPESFEAQLDENFTPLIIQSGIEMDYSFLSGGERTAVALAYRLALNQTINSILSQIKTKDIVILDEPTEGFSEIQIDKIREVLQELNVLQLIIVSHEQKIESFVDNIIKIKKEDGISLIDNGKKTIA